MIKISQLGVRTGALKMKSNQVKAEENNFSGSTESTLALIRFRDIRTFPLCPYRCDVSWSMLEFYIKSANRDRSDFLNLNPDFQRAHVWTTEQQVSYVEYILRGGTSGKELYFNCPDYTKGSSVGPYVIVDGKQRLESVRRFMRGEIPAFGHLRTEYSDDPDMLVARFSWNIAGLKTRAEVLEWYLNFNAGGTVHTADELARVREMLSKERG